MNTTIIQPATTPSTNGGYEYQVSPHDPCIVQVRCANRRLGERGTSWKTYMECYSPSDARRILSMLDPERGTVTP